LYATLYYHILKSENIIFSDSHSGNKLLLKVKFTKLSELRRSCKDKYVT